MIASLTLTDFKNFADETIRVGPFTLIIGANASGKSNIRDAFRFLHGVGRGYALADIIGERYGAGGQIEWAGVRGGADEIIRFGRPSFSLTVEMGETRYSISAGIDKARAGAFRVVGEKLKRGQRTIYATHPGEGDPVHAQSDSAILSVRMDKTGKRKRGYRVGVRPDQPALTQILERRYVVRAHKEIVQSVIDELGSMRFLDLSPERMRQPAFPGQTVLGDGGENLPTVLREICEDESRKRDLASWIRELTPMDARDFEFPSDPAGRIHLVFREGDGRTVSAYAASDGTLRFIAMLAALLGKNPARLYFFEEIDNGIHPARMRLLLDLIEGQTAKGDTRVITTTHSPDLLTLINDASFESAAIVYRNEDSENGIARPVSKLPNIRALRKSQGLGRLHSIGWMEDALAFSGESAP